MLKEGFGEPNDKARYLFMYIYIYVIDFECFFVGNIILDEL